jgi:transcriptional regulator with XRE-family HTH domain
MTTLDRLIDRRPPRRELVEAHKKRMVAEARAWRLRELRQQVDLTQVELASELHVSQNRVSRIERGEIDKAQVDTLRRYVAALGGTLRLEVQIGEETFQLA